jgi:hypothetical protein
VACVWDCKTVPFYDAAGSHSIGNCSCISYHYFSATKECLVNCSALPRSTGSGPGSECICQKNFVWNSTTHVCQLDCNQVSNLNQTIASPSDSCLCNLPYEWDANIQDCVLNCSLDPMSNHTKGQPDPLSCSCLGDGSWNGSQCVLNCSKDHFLNSSGPVTAGLCACKGYSRWDPVNFECRLNCSDDPNSDQIATQYDPYSCDCKGQNYIWFSQAFKC